MNRIESLHRHNENSNYYKALTHLERKRDRCKKQQRGTVRDNTHCESRQPGTQREITTVSTTTLNVVDGSNIEEETLLP